MNLLEERRPLALLRRGRGPAAFQTTNQIVGSRRWWALGAVLLTMFFSSMYQTIMSTALPVIIGELQGLGLYSWAFTAYMLASALTMPIYGKLSDVYGRKPFYILGLGLFLVGSVAGGMVRTMEQLIAARAFQGLGAGAMLSMPRATVGDIFSPRERGRWMGVMGSVFGLASIIGPAVGGWITDHWGWRWVFYVTLPVALVALAAVVYALPTVRTGERARVDWSGSAWLAAGLSALVVGVTVAGDGGWASPSIFVLLTAAGVFLVLFVRNEARTESPIIALDLFRNRIFASSAAVVFLMNVAMFGAIAFLPLYAQGVLAQTAQQSGRVLTPMMLSFVAGSVVSGQLVTRTGRYKVQAVAGSLIAALGMSLLVTMGPDTPIPTVVRNVVLVGLGQGTVLPVLNVAVQNAFPYRMMGMVNATQQFIQSLGGILAGPVLGTVLTSTFTAELDRQMTGSVRAAVDRLPPEAQAALLNPQGLINAGTQEALRETFAALGSQGSQLFMEFIGAVRGALGTGTERLFLTGFAFALLGVVATLFLKEVHLQRDEYYRSARGEDEA